VRKSEHEENDGVGSHGYWTVKDMSSECSDVESDELKSHREYPVLGGKDPPDDHIGISWNMVDCPTSGRCAESWKDMATPEGVVTLHSDPVDHGYTLLWGDSVFGIRPNWSDLMPRLLGQEYRECANSPDCNIGVIPGRVSFHISDRGTTSQGDQVHVWRLDLGGPSSHHQTMWELPRAWYAGIEPSEP